MFYEWKEDSLFLNIYLQPSSNKDEIVGEHNGHLKIKVRAKPIEDEANHALIALLAKAFDLPKNQVHLVQGRKSRWKLLELYQPRKLIKEIVLLPSRRRGSSDASPGFPSTWE